MSILVNSIIQDPSAIAECLAAPLTALYMLKLNVISSDKKLTVNACAIYNTGQCLNKRHFNIKDKQDLELKEKLLRAFAVGQLISTSKKSLRKQFFSRSM